MNKKYIAVKIQQRVNNEAVQFVAFSASAKDVAQWAGVSVLGEEANGVQRILKKARVRAIRNFFNQSESNTIPTAITLAFLPDIARFEVFENSFLQELDPDNGPEKRIELGMLHFSFTPGERAALVVDGQHRLQGMAALDEDIPINVVALINSSPTEQAFQFIVINNKAAKVPTDNVKGIIANIDEAELRDRLSVAGVDYANVPATMYELDNRADSPFKNLLAWPLNQTTNKIITLNALEYNLTYIRNTIPGFKEEADEAIVREILIAIWRGLAETYASLWLSNDRFMAKVSMNAVNEYAVDRMTSAYLDGDLDVYDPDKIYDYIKRVFSRITPELWELPWSIKIQDSAVVREIIVSDLKRVARNSLSSDTPWHDGLTVVQV